MLTSVVILRLYSMTFLTLSLWDVQSNAISTIALQDGQYNGIVVAISSAVPESSRDVVINGIKDMFTKANEYLYAATKKLTTFGKVTILAPREWTGSYSYDVATHETWNDADVRVGPANPQYGNQPYTLQGGLCGERGSYIHFTPEFFTKKNETIRKYGPEERILVHEWAHYKYGVFDEYGYQGDSYYPAAYSDGEQLHPTACSDSPLQGSLSSACSNKSPSDPECKYHANVNQQGVKSSIMSLHFLPEVTQFCDSSNHNAFAPTKHNALCSRRSIWDVLNSNPDFSKPKWAYAVPFSRPTFRVVRPSASRYVLLLDCSTNMNDFVNKNSTSTMQRISFVRSAAVNFIEENLPDETWLSLISFGPKPQVLKPLQQLTSMTRKGFTNAVPRVTCGGPERNVVHAIKEAIKQLDTRSTSRTDGIIITITNGITDDAHGYPQIKSELQQRNIRAINIIYPPMPEITALPSLAEATSGQNYMIAEIGEGQRGNSSTLAQLLGALDDVVASQSGNPQQDRVIVYEHVHAANEEKISGSFTIDPSIGKNMKVTVSYFKRENIFDVSLTSPSRRNFDSDDYDDQTNKRTIVFAIKEMDVQIGQWMYQIDANKLDDQPITVTVSARPRAGFPVTLRSWTNVGNSGINASTTPMVIHAELFKGSRPIVNAKVRAIIERPKINNTFSFVELELFDNGNGAPDATRNDGIYTRYFTNFVAPARSFGFYSLTVYADDNDGRAQVVGEDQRWASHSGVMPKDTDTPYCCGSKAPVMQTEPTGSFQRYSSAPAFLILASPPPGSDVFPPSTVRDLNVDRVDPVSGYITLSWTAPGDNYDSGQVSSYELRYFHDFKALITNFEWAQQVLESIIPVSAGSVQTLTFYPPDGRNRNYFFALRAVDRTGLKSEISNVAMCFVPPEPTTTTQTTKSPQPRPTLTPSPSTVARPLLTAELIGIIVGCTLAFLLAIAVIVGLICASQRRRKLQEEKMTHHTVAQVHGPDVVRPPSIASIKEVEWKTNAKNGDIAVISGHHDTGIVVDNGIGGGGVPGGVYYTNSSLIPRQFVPASEILQHHDQQRHHSYGNMGLPHVQNGNMQYYYEEDNDSISKHPYNNHYAPMEVIIDRSSISSKPSSYGSQQTAEVTSTTGFGGQIRDNGYVNSSYEDGSENSAETARLRPEPVAYLPLVSAPKRIMSESQV